MPTFYGPPSDGSGVPAQLADELDNMYTARPIPPTTAATLGEFDPIRSVYNLRPEHLERTRAAFGKAFAGTGQARVAFVGDSTTSGGASGVNGAGAWPRQFLKMAVSRGYPSNGTGVVGTWRGSAPDPRWTIPEGWVALTSASTLVYNQTNANALVFTSDVSGTIARLFYGQRGTAFTVSIDGGAPVTVTPDGTTNAWATYEVTGLADTTHTISVVRTGTGAAQVYAAEVANGATGVRIFQAGVGGAKVPTPEQVSWMTVDALPTSTTGFNADCAFVMFETNDAGVTSVEQYKSNMRGILAVMKGNGADVVLITAVPSGGKDFTPYTAALYELADEFDLPLIDLQDRMGSYERSNALGLMGDALHPTPAGYAVVAQAVVGSLAIV